jgi:Fe-S cluster assembly iron-binding protein IscA
MKMTTQQVIDRIHAADYKELSATVLMRNYGDSRAIVEINGCRFFIDESARLPVVGIQTDFSKRKTSAQFGFHTGRDEIEYTNTLPKLSLSDFTKQSK